MRYTSQNMVLYSLAIYSQDGCLALIVFQSQISYQIKTVRAWKHKCLLLSFVYSLQGIPIVQTLQWDELQNTLAALWGVNYVCSNCACGHLTTLSVRPINEDYPNFVVTGLVGPRFKGARQIRRNLYFAKINDLIFNQLVTMFKPFINFTNIYPTIGDFCYFLVVFTIFF